MTLRVRFNGIRSTFRELNEEVTQEVREELGEEGVDLLRSLRESTPIQTGFARSRWRVSRTNPELGMESGITITNDAEYIDDLNMGSSQQAPARFIEQAVLRQGCEPVGPIVDDRPGGRRRP